jgi:hypothetical protein
VKTPLASAFPREKVARIVHFHQRWPRLLDRLDALRSVGRDLLQSLRPSHRP